MFIVDEWGGMRLIKIEDLRVDFGESHAAKPLQAQAQQRGQVEWSRFEKRVRLTRR